MTDFDLVHEACDRAGYLFWPQKPFDLFLFGIRSAAPSDSNLFDDTIGVAYVNGSGVPTVERWPATTDPGRKSMADPWCATVIPHQLRKVWTRGQHHPGTPGAYDCLVPTVGAVIPVWRGKDRSKVFFDSSGIQLHHAGASSVLVDGWSAGCQVLQHADDLTRLLWLYDEQVRRLGLRYVSYTLFDAAADPTLSALLARWA